MKITTNAAFEKPNEVTSADVLQFFLDRAENRGGDSKGRRRERAVSLEGVVSRMFAELVDSGVLRARHVERIFDYDVSAED